MAENVTKGHPPKARANAAATFVNHVIMYACYGLENEEDMENNGMLYIINGYDYSRLYVARGSSLGIFSELSFKRF